MGSQCSTITKVEAAKPLTLQNRKGFRLVYCLRHRFKVAENRDPALDGKSGSSHCKGAWNQGSGIHWSHYYNDLPQLLCMKIVHPILHSPLNEDPWQKYVTGSSTKYPLFILSNWSPFIFLVVLIMAADQVPFSHWLLGRLEPSWRFFHKDIVYVRFNLILSPRSHFMLHLTFLFLHEILLLFFF